jgi:hypothetical protein
MSIELLLLAQHGMDKAELDVWLPHVQYSTTWLQINSTKNRNKVEKRAPQPPVPPFALQVPGQVGNMIRGYPNPL